MKCDPNIDDGTCRSPANVADTPPTPSTDPDSPQARQEATQFKPGTSGNPSGRRRGSYTGLKKARELIDKLLKNPKNMKALEKALQEEFDTLGPADFMAKYCDLKTLTRDLTRPADDGTLIVDDMPHTLVIRCATREDTDG